MNKTKREVVTIKKVRWTCHNPDHSHMTEAVAQACINKELSRKRPPRQTNNYEELAKSIIPKMIDAYESGATYKTVGQMLPHPVGVNRTRQILHRYIQRACWAVPASVVDDAHGLLISKSAAEEALGNVSYPQPGGAITGSRYFRNPIVSFLFTYAPGDPPTFVTHVHQDYQRLPKIAWKMLPSAGFNDWVSGVQAAYPGLSFDEIIQQINAKEFDPKLSTGAAMVRVLEWHNAGQSAEDIALKLGCTECRAWQLIRIAIDRHNVGRAVEDHMPTPGEP